MAGSLSNKITGLLIIGVCMAGGALLAGAAHPPGDRTFHIVAHKYAFDPPVLHVNVGDRVTVYLTSRDVTHGFYVEGHDIDAKISPDEKPLLRHPSLNDAFKEVESIQFVAKREGKFRYRCSQTCGFLHPFMAGEMVVTPNRPYGAGLGGALGVTLAALIAAMRKGGPKDG